MRVLHLAAVAVTALVAAGCGGDPAAPAAQPGRSATSAAADAEGAAAGGAARHNPDDVMFLQMMVTHHGQGSRMAELAAEKGRRQDLTLLAGAIAATQKDEAATMRGWLKSWDERTSASGDHSAHAAHGGLPATGEEEIAALEDARGTAFETDFLNLMIAHQHAAVEMADLELENGVNHEARLLARRIVKSRTAEIELMLDLLNGGTTQPRR
jgi:uncharacterized protein (DUF305 family)